MEKNLTALMCEFVASYHTNNCKCKIISENNAIKVLGNDYEDIKNSLSNNIKFFNKDFNGTDDEGVRWIVDNQLGPSILARKAFTRKSLLNSIKMGNKQYLSFASGYETLMYDLTNKVNIYEIDREEMIKDKINRLDKGNVSHNKISYISCDFSKDSISNKILKSNYDKNYLSFSSLLGISYYLTKDEFTRMIKEISSIICNGSTIIFDYPNYDVSDNSKLNEELANAANETMKSKYNYKEIENILEDNGLLIYEHLNNEEITDKYFNTYNTFNINNKIYVPSGTSYCLAVKMTK